MEVTQSGSVVVVDVVVVVVVVVVSGKVLQMDVVEVVVVWLGVLPQRVRQGPPASQLLEEDWKVSPGSHE